MVSKEVCRCCGDCDDKIEKKDLLKVYFCPRCRSHDVGYIFKLRNIFGVIPKMRCRKCGFELPGGFPIMVIDKRKLGIKNKKRKVKKR